MEVRLDRAALAAAAAEPPRAADRDLVRERHGAPARPTSERNSASIVGSGQVSTS